MNILKVSCAHTTPLSFLSRTILKIKPRQDPKTLIPNKNKLRYESRLHAGPKGFQPSRNSEKTGKSDLDLEDDPPIPQEVFKRMMGMIVIYVGTPLELGMTILKILNVLKDKNVSEIPLWVPFLTTLLTFGASAFGTVYGSLSTNLDPTKTNSLFELEEAKENWVEMWNEE